MLFARTHHIDTPDNHGPVVNVIIWFFLVANVLWVITRIATKLAISHSLATDDYLILTALVRKIRPVNVIITLNQLPDLQHCSLYHGLRAGLRRAWSTFPGLDLIEAANISAGIFANRSSSDFPRD